MILPLAILCFLIVLAVDLYTDFQRWFKKRGIDHKRGAWLRVAGTIPATILFTVAHNVNSWWVFLVVIVMEFFTFMFLFNGIFNIVRGQPWNHRGENPLDKIPLWVQVCGMIGGVSAYIITSV